MKTEAAVPIDVRIPAMIGGKAKPRRSVPRTTFN